VFRHDKAAAVRPDTEADVVSLCFDTTEQQQYDLILKPTSCRCVSTRQSSSSMTYKVHKVLTLTAKKRDQRGLQNSDKNKLVEIKVKLEAN